MKLKKIISVAAAFALAVSLLNIGAFAKNVVLPKDTYQLIGATANVNGDECATVDVVFSPCAAGWCLGLTADMSTTATLNGVDSNDITLTALTMGGGITAAVSAATGRVAYLDASYTGFELAAGEAILTAQYTVAAGTPSGAYEVTLSVDTVSNYNLDKVLYTDYTAIITVSNSAPVAHEHNWAEAWTTDTTHHWHECSVDGCDVTDNSAKSGYAEHTYDDEADTTCECGYTRVITPSEHVHSWYSEWSKNETHHWHECTADGCDVTENSAKAGYAEHTYDDATDTTCECGYTRVITPSEHVHSWSSEWSKDETHHWHECSAADCDLTENSGMSGYGTHAYTDDSDTTCNTCGYTRTVTPPAHEHNWDAGVVTTVPGYGVPGVKTYTCDCGATYTESIDALPYPYVPPVTSTTTTTTKTNGDGSVTTTTTNKATGMVTATTKYNDGTVLKIVTAGSGTQNISVTVPANVEQATVAVPVENPTPGTVVVVLHSDGTREVVKTCVTTDNAVILTLAEGATLKLVDNSKTFTDTRGHWGADYVDFVSSRDLFQGLPDGSFAPDLTLSGGMITTVLARLAGEDTTPAAGERWYDLGMNWAENAGLTVDFGGDDEVSRERVVAMLWQMAGTPASDFSLVGFGDTDTISSGTAWSWAVENGIINGMDGNLNPNGKITRVQFAAMLQRYCCVLNGL